MQARTLTKDGEHKHMSLESIGIGEYPVYSYRIGGGVVHLVEHHRTEDGQHQDRAMLIPLKVLQEIVGTHLQEEEIIDLSKLTGREYLLGDDNL